MTDENVHFGWLGLQIVPALRSTQLPAPRSSFPLFLLSFNPCAALYSARTQDSLPNFTECDPVYDTSVLSKHSKLTKEPCDDLVTNANVCLLDSDTVLPLPASLHRCSSVGSFLCVFPLFCRCLFSNIYKYHFIFSAQFSYLFIAGR